MHSTNVVFHYASSIGEAEKEIFKNRRSNSKEMHLQRRRFGSMTLINIIKNVTIATRTNALKPIVNRGHAGTKPKQTPRFPPDFFVVFFQHT